MVPRPSHSTEQVQPASLKFESHQVHDLNSVAHLFPRNKPRCGVYVLTFDDGERYVGQASNIVGRFAAHRGRWNDIRTLDFTRVPGRSLDAVERDLIRDHLQCSTLRNITHALGTGTRDEVPDLDLIVDESDQIAWLTGEEPSEDVADRVDDTELRPKGREKYHRLSTHVLGPRAVRLTRLYVHSTMLRPRATELTFWSASAMAATNAAHSPRLIAVSVNKMETFVLGWEKYQPDQMWGFLNVSKSAMCERYGSPAEFVRPRQDWLDFDEDSGYESGGSDVLRLYVNDDSRMLELLAPEDGDVGVVRAARRLNRMLMRKGPTLQWRWHCFDLADQLVEPTQV